MLQIIKHPFNEEIGLKTILPSTRKLIVGSFPPNEVTMNNNPRLNYYYGSNDNKFWDLFKMATDATFDFTAESIQDYLLKKQFGIIDIIQECTRKNDTLSSDKDLTIIIQRDILTLVQNTACRDIYTTSKWVTTLLKMQLSKSLLIQKNIDQYAKDFRYEQITGKFSQEGSDNHFRIFTLFSPSDNGLRGIKKGLNNKGKINDPKEYRIQQYKTLLNI